jgi:hypothetical protein
MEDIYHHLRLAGLVIFLGIFTWATYIWTVTLICQMIGISYIFLIFTEKASKKGRDLIDGCAEWYNENDRAAKIIKIATIIPFIIIWIRISWSLLTTK